MGVMTQGEKKLSGALPMRQGLTQLHGKWDGWNRDEVDYICSSIPMVILWGWNYIYDNIVGMGTVVAVISW